MRTPDAFDYEDSLEQDGDDGIQCRRCGTAGLYWQSVTQADGRSDKSVLFDSATGRRHVCSAAAGAGAFDVVPE